MMMMMGHEPGDLGRPRIARHSVAPRIQGYLDHKKLRLSRTLQNDYISGSMVAQGGVAGSYERGTFVA